MNIAVWIIQGLLAISFAMAGFMKTTTPKDKLELKMPWAKDFSASTIKFIGISELLAAVGLILPMGLNILPILTAIAATALAIVMLLAIATHLKRKEYKEVGMNIVLGGLALFVAIVRF
jgi:putative oxidoreductase